MREGKLWLWRMMHDGAGVWSSVRTLGREMCIVSGKYASRKQQGRRDIARSLVDSVATRVCVATSQLGMVDLNVTREKYGMDIWIRILRNCSNTVYGYAQENTRW